MRVILLFSFLCLNSAFSEQKSVSANFQYAGDIGKYSFGVGKRWSSFYYLAFHYGVVPADRLNDKIESYALKNNFSVYDFEEEEWLLDFYIGLTVFYVPATKFDTNSSNNAPKNYYRESEYRGLVALGAEVIHERSYSLYYELGINDIWLTNSYNNSEVDFEDYLVAGLGARWIFN